MGPTGFWRESIRIDAVAKAHQRSLPAPPPKTLVVVTLWWTRTTSVSAHGRFTCKTPIFIVAGPGFEPGTP